MVRSYVSPPKYYSVFPASKWNISIQYIGYQLIAKMLQVEIPQQITTKSWELPRHNTPGQNQFLPGQNHQIITLSNHHIIKLSLHNES